MLKFKKYLEETNRAPNTRFSYFNAFVHFIDHRAYKFPILKCLNGIFVQKKTIQNFTKDDIRKMIDVSSLRDRAIIYVMTLSGMKQAEMRKHSIEKFLDAINDNVTEIKTLKDLFRYEKNLKIQY